MAPAGTTLALRVAAAPFGHESALDAIASLIAEQPDAINLRFGYACALEDLGQIVPRSARTSRCSTRDPRTSARSPTWDRSPHAAGVREGARAFYSKAAVEHPDDPVARINLGNALVEDGEFDAARVHYEAALALAPGHPNAHFALALLCRELGRRRPRRRARRAGVRASVDRDAAVPRQRDAAARAGPARGRRRERRDRAALRRPVRRDDGAVRRELPAGDRAPAARSDLQRDRRRRPGGRGARARRDDRRRRAGSRS